MTGRNDHHAHCAGERDRTLRLHSHNRFCIFAAMLDFFLAIDKSGHCNVFEERPHMSAHAPERTLFFNTVQNTETGGETRISIGVFWWESHPYHNFSDNVEVGQDGLALLVGYPLTRDFKPIRTAREFRRFERCEVRGDFFYLRIGNDGQVNIRKSPICSYQVYYGERPGFSVLASRSTLAATLLQQTTEPALSLDFARWICTWGGGGNLAALFDEVKNVIFNQEITVEDGKILVSEPDYAFLFDEELQASYQTSPIKYWDEVFDYCVEAMKVADFSNERFEFAISGGMDSRLLLGLVLAAGHADRLKRLFVYGPKESPDVRSASALCEALGLDLEWRDGRSDNARRPTLDDKLLGHVHITEGEMSPQDPTYSARPARLIQFHGQESGLRNIAGTRPIHSRDDLLEWLRIHLADGDKCRVFRAGLAQKNLEETAAIVERAHAAGISWDQIPTLHRLLFRSGRWVSRTWRAYNNRFFAPYVFADINVYRATFNAGAVARSRAEFHFEMCRRVNPKLIEVPLAGQIWNRALVESSGLSASDPIVWKEGERPVAVKQTHVALLEAYPDVRDFLLKHEGRVTTALLDKTRLAEFDPYGKHPSVLLAFWNIVQVAMAESVRNVDIFASGERATQFGVPSFDAGAN